MTAGPDAGVWWKIGVWTDAVVAFEYTALRANDRRDGDSEIWGRFC